MFLIVAGEKAMIRDDRERERERERESRWYLGIVRKKKSLKVAARWQMRLII
jgi:hypothetical protein